MIPRFGRAHLAASIALVALLAGCVGVGQAPSPDPSISRLHEQAKGALERWAGAVASGGPGTFVPTGELTGQVGDWEESVGENNKTALMSGMVEAAVDLPSNDPPDGELRWQDGSIQAVRLVSAKAALSQLKSDVGTGCSDCVPLRIAGATLRSGPIETTRGPATAPVWEFSVQGSDVRITRVAIATGMTVESPVWDPNDPPVGISIESATGKRDERELTVSFVGSPDGGDKPCGADYTAEAVESATAAVVIVTEHPHAFGETCSLVGAVRTATVELAAPLGDRALLEVKEGRPVPVVLTP